MNKNVLVIILIVVVSNIYAQKKNINAAWRALTDYQSTLNDKADVQYLLKAKENIDWAIQNPETKEDPKALTYYSQIYYELYKYYQKNTDLNTNPYQYLNTSIEAFQILKEKHPKVAATPELQNHGINLLNTSNQEAVKLFNDKSFLDASQMFYQHYVLQKKILNTMDTTGLFNAFISAYKSNNYEKINQYANELMNINADQIKVYQLLYNFYQHQKDTSQVVKILEKGRKKFPDDPTLLNLETDYLINTKQYNKAINNLKKIVQQDSTNALLLLTLGNLYDNIANQKMEQKKYSDTVQNLFQNAVQNYLKSYKQKDRLDKENLFTLNYNLGAFYTNFGLFYYNRRMKEFKITDLSQKQKEVEDKRKEYTQMGIPYLKEAESIKPEDSTVITALYRVYALIGDTKNAEVYKNKMLKK